MPDDYRLIKEDIPCPNCEDDCACYDETQTELWRYMDKQGFKPPDDMQKIIDERGLVVWKGIVFRRLDGKEKYFEVEYAKKDEVAMRWNGNFCCVNIILTLVFDYTDKRCIAAKWIDENGEHQKRYKGKPV